MRDWLSVSAAARPDGIALVADGESLTYRDLNLRAAGVAAHLASLGVRRGSRVALLPANNAETVAAIHAISKLGATMVLLNTRLTDGELAAQIERVQPATVLRLNEENKIDISKMPVLLPESGYIDLNDAACILFTSGTSGTPKAAVLTWSNFWHSAMASAYRIGTLPNDRWLCVLPLFHVGGLSIVLRSCLYGTTVDLRRKFDAAEIHRALVHEDVSLISLVPTLLHRLLDVRESQPATYSQLRMVLLGGAAATVGLMERARTANIPIATTYGLTEATSQVATALPSDALHKPDSVGKALPFTDVRVVDADDRDMPAGADGEVIVRGPTVMRGYLDDAEATARVLRNGWLHTGDIGHIDADGDLHILQRRSDLIVSGGENVYPAEVEAALRTHAAVADCLVVGVDSVEWGQQVAALVVLRFPASADAIKQHVRARLAGYKVPKVVCVAEALPLNAAGKPDRAAARLLLAGG